MNVSLLAKRLRYIFIGGFIVQHYSRITIFLDFFLKFRKFSEEIRFIEIGIEIILRKTFSEDSPTKISGKTRQVGPH